MRVVAQKRQLGFGKKKQILKIVRLYPFIYWENPSSFVFEPFELTNPQACESAGIYAVCGGR